VQRFASENLAMKAQIAEQADIIKELAAKVGALSDPERRGPGRPRKEEQVAA
jgi:hypothetical protein